MVRIQVVNNADVDIDIPTASDVRSTPAIFVLAKPPGSFGTLARLCIQIGLKASTHYVTAIY